MSSAAKPLAKVAKVLPLFASDRRRAVRTLCVRRQEHGRWVRAAQSFEPEQLPDREAVRARFGGGHYEVIGRDGRRIVARTRFVLDGPARPLREEPASERALSGDEHAFATAAGARAKRVFALLDEGCDLGDIVQKTGLEPAVVRALSEDWLDLLERSHKLAERRSELWAMRHAGQARAWEASWTTRS